MATTTTAPQGAKNNFFTAFLKDVFLGWTKKEAIYGLSLVALQVLTYLWNPDSLAGFLTGVTGTICVLLVAKRKISNYAFGLIQTSIALYLGLSVHLWGESLENLFYFITQFMGFFTWRKHLINGDVEEDVEIVETRKFKLRDWFLSVLSIMVGTLIFGFIFQNLHGTQPYVDAFTLVTAIIAQIIMLARYREQWTFWFILNVVSLGQWMTLGNWSMVALYVAFIINNAYGYREWTRGAK